MTSRNTCRRVSSVNVKKQWPMPCVYCHDDEGAFLKNGKTKYGRHHVKDCLKTMKRKNSRGRWKTSFKKEVAKDGSVWTVKVGNKNNCVLESPKTAFCVLGAIDDNIEDDNKEKFMKAEKAKMIPSISMPKAAMGGWLAVAKKPKAKKPMPKNERKIEIPIAGSPKSNMSSPKRVEELKKETKFGYIRTPFKKGSVMSFSDIQEKFSNTDSWGDSDEDR